MNLSNDPLIFGKSYTPFYPSLYTKSPHLKNIYKMKNFGAFRAHF